MQYTRLEYNLDEIADKGRGSIGYNVVGYRDRECVELDIDRQNGGWRIRVNRSSYVSRDTEQEPNEITAMENSIAALQDACQLGRAIEKDTARLEARWQAAEAVRRAEAERKAAEDKAAYDADPAVGMKLAKHIIKQMVYEIRAKDGGSYDEISIHFATRGKRSENKLNVRYARSGLTLFSLGWHKISKDRALAVIADSAIDALKVDSLNIVDPKLAKFMMV